MKGRPIGSVIRQNIIEILYFMGNGYGYDIYKIYMDIFPKVTMRSIYYHLRKGLELGEFKIHKAGNEKGDYSWGSEAEKVYYSLGNGAKPFGKENVKEYFDKNKK
ncbi:hypothetical protein ISS04_03515 [Candidatus Woesearchaeota archaeon]|nr:hypothetical protein [Candidatus Woesearchaeota archaeon]